MTKESVKAMTADAVMAIFHERFGETIAEFDVPPPSFVTMQGEFLSIDPDAGVLVARFPVQLAFLNPYGAMQGGMVAAAIDNTIGPLSMFYNPPNVTRRMELKYSRPITPDVKAMVVEASFVEQQGAWLNFRANARDEVGMLLARCRSTHWILGE